LKKFEVGELFHLVQFDHALLNTELVSIENSYALADVPISGYVHIYLFCLSGIY
jgi:hypothetical protein